MLHVHAFNMCVLLKHIIFAQMKYVRNVPCIYTRDKQTESVIQNMK